MVLGGTGGNGNRARLSVDEKGVQEAEAVEVGGTESVAVVLEAVGTVVEIGTDELAVASADTESDFCRLALLAGTMAHPDAESWRFPMFTDCFATSAANWSSLSAFRVSCPSGYTLSSMLCICPSHRPQDYQVSRGRE